MPHHLPYPKRDAVSIAISLPPGLRIFQDGSKTIEVLQALKCQIHLLRQHLGILFLGVGAKERADGFLDAFPVGQEAGGELEGSEGGRHVVTR
jgi:hypothetical protein